MCNRCIEGGIKFGSIDVDSWWFFRVKWCASKQLLQWLSVSCGHLSKMSASFHWSVNLQTLGLVKNCYELLSYQKVMNGFFFFFCWQFQYCEDKEINLKSFFRQCISPLFTTGILKSKWEWDPVCKESAIEFSRKG